MKLVELVEIIHNSDEPDEAFDEELDALAVKYGIKIKFVDDYYHEGKAEAQA